VGLRRDYTPDTAVPAGPGRIEEDIVGPDIRLVLACLAGACRTLPAAGEGCHILRLVALAVDPAAVAADPDVVVVGPAAVAVGPVVQVFAAGVAVVGLLAVDADFEAAVAVASANLAEAPAVDLVVAAAADVLQAEAPADLAAEARLVAPAVAEVAEMIAIEIQGQDPAAAAFAAEEAAVVASAVDLVALVSPVPFLLVAAVEMMMSLGPKFVAAAEVAVAAAGSNPEALVWRLPMAAAAVGLAAHNAA